MFCTIYRIDTISQRKNIFYKTYPLPGVRAFLPGDQKGHRLNSQAFFLHTNGDYKTVTICSFNSHSKGIEKSGENVPGQKYVGQPAISEVNQLDGIVRN